MRVPSRARPATWAGVVASAALLLSACGGGDIQTEETPDGSGGGGSGSGSDCTELNLAVNPWVGMEASAAVVGRVAEEKLGCTVNYVKTKEEISWAGLGTDEVDVIIEDWGHPDLEEQYFAESGDGTAEDFGPNGNEGIIGWYVPPWLAEEHPDITNWQNLNKYAAEFATSESGGKGQFLGADPSYVQFDEAIVKNLDLNFKVVFSGSEAASIAAFQKAEENKEWLIGYFYEPQWLFAEVPLVRVELPPYKPGCQEPASSTDCDYPVTPLKKIVSTDWTDAGESSVDLVQNFEWTNEDKNQVAAYIADEGMTAEAAADKWIAENQDKVDEWLSASG
jgi:glycine betaine/proline transport system substrate-binding protein